MSYLMKLKEILENQAERGIESGDWDRLNYTLSAGIDEGAIVMIEAVHIGFHFSRSGRLIGIYNWKE